MTDFSFNIGADIVIPQDDTPFIVIPQDDTPFIVLCGPPACGKTMVLKSLANYINSRGYYIDVNHSFINDKNYCNYCEGIYKGIFHENIPMPQTLNPYILDVIDEYGKTKVHILDAPGDDFFSYDESDKEPFRDFPRYLNRIACRYGHYRKVIYIIFLDLDSEISSKRDDTNPVLPVLRHSLRTDMFLRKKYEAKMNRLYDQYVRNYPGKVILLYNKVDLPLEGRWGNADGCRFPEEILKDAKANYPRLFITRKFLFWNINYYKFLPFCTGEYYEDGSYGYASSSYSEALLKELLKYL